MGIVRNAEEVWFDDCFVLVVVSLRQMRNTIINIIVELNIFKRDLNSEQHLRSQRIWYKIVHFTCFDFDSNSITLYCS